MNPNGYDCGSSKRISTQESVGSVQRIVLNSQPDRMTPEFKLASEADNVRDTYRS